MTDRAAFGAEIPREPQPPIGDFSAVRVPDDLAGCRALIEEQARALCHLAKQRDEARAAARDFFATVNAEYGPGEDFERYPWLKEKDDGG